jgi:hypothetical protein
MKKITAVLAVFAFALLVSLPLAQAESNTSKKVEALKKVEQMFENKLEIKSSDRAASVILKQNGEFQVSGVKVNSVNAAANTMNVSLYGFSRDVNVGSARIIGAGREVSLADFRAGDILSASGRFNEATRAITVEKIHNLSVTGTDRSKVEAKINELLKMIEELKKKLETAR